MSGNLLRSKLVRLLAVLFAFALIAAACGDDDGGDGEATSDDGGEETATDDGEEADGEAADGEEADGEAADGEEATDGGAEGEGFEVSFGIVEPGWIDSFNVQDSEGFQVARLLYDGLTDFNEELEAVPAVATEWSSDDNVTWNFTLRDDVTFHDGSPVTAQSFVNAFNYVANPENLSDVAYYGSYIAGIAGWADVEAGEATEVSGVVAVDDTTLEITLEAPYPLLPKALAHPVFSPRIDGEVDPDQPIGNGPYMMDGAWQQDVNIRVARYEDYYGEAGGPDAIDFDIFDSQETQFLAVQDGSLNIGDVPPAQLASAPDEFGDRYIEQEIGAYTYLGFPNDIPPFDNLDIRRALSLAIDRDGIANVVYEGTRVPATGFAPELAPGAAAGVCTDCAYDPEAAAELFEAAGGIPSGEVNLYFNTGGGHEGWIEAVANGWEQTFGITVNIVGQEFAPYLDELQAGNIDGPYRLGWLWDVPTAENFLSPLFLSTSSDNYSRYVNEDFDAAIEEFNTAATEEEGQPALQTAQEILAADMPVAPIVFSKDVKVFTDDITNVVHSVFGFTYLENVEPAG